MTLQPYLLEQISLHPSIQPQDIIKLCYQAARGGEHLLSDEQQAWHFFLREYEALSPSDEPLYEPISPHICRVNLRAWKGTHLPPEWLFQMFVMTCQHRTDGTAQFLTYIAQTEELLDRLPFTQEAWEICLSEYKQAGMPSVHHSEEYRQREAPAYRIVDLRLMRLLPILERVALLSSGVLVIDGRAASGKSTMAAALSMILNAPVIHMDDFFLPPALRTPERLAQPGGNVHYERFQAEVLPNLRDAAPFSYRKFDCGQMDYHGEISVPAALWRIVEGSYSLHPVFGHYGDLTVFSHVEPKEQMERILTRNGPELAERFRDLWIPMEERYFGGMGISEMADLVL